jgi:hypothetical protein
MADDAAAQDAGLPATPDVPAAAVEEEAASGGAEVSFAAPADESTPAATADVLITLGTPHASWEPAARAALAATPGADWLAGAFTKWLDAELGTDPLRWASADPVFRPPAGLATTPRWGALDARGCWVVDALLRDLPHARLMVFFDDPAAAMAAWLAQGARGSAEDALASWTAGARRLDTAARAQPDRFVFIDAAAATAQPERLGAVLARHLGAAPSDAWRRDAAPVDRTTQAVASALAAGADEAWARFHSLRALCREPEFATAGLQGTEPLALASLVQRLRQPGHGDDLSGHGALTLERDALALALERTTASEGALRARLGATLDELAAAKGQLRTATTERGLVIRQVLETQRELARYFSEFRKLEQSAGPVSARIRANRVVFSAPVESGPHRHIDAHAHGLKSPSQGTHDQLVRLVNHHGRPGLALLVPQGKPNPLSAWHPNLQEDDRSGLLLVPGDADARAYLERLGTSDWLTVLGLVHLMECELAAASFPQAASWRVVASRLHMQLRELPARLRYDAIRVDVEATGGPDFALTMNFLAPLYGDEVMSTISVRWRPERPRGSKPGEAPLEWLLPTLPGEVPGLASWPVDDQGQPEQRLALPAGPGLAKAELLERWAAFTPRERELLQALLDALPACADAVEPAELPAGWNSDRLRQAAQAVGAETRHQLGGAPWRRLMSRGLRRLSGAG